MKRGCVRILIVFYSIRMPANMTIGGQSKKSTNSSVRAHSIAAIEGITTEYRFEIAMPQGVKNPIAKLKMTGNQRWTEKAQKYQQWKAHIQKTFIDTLQESDRRAADRNTYLHGKPIKHDERCHIHMFIHIKWDGFTHADPENVFGSIADALLVDDKYTSGSFIYEHHDGPASVDVWLILSDQKI